MGPRMVNLSECMDPKRYSLEAVPAGCAPGSVPPSAPLSSGGVGGFAGGRGHVSQCVHSLLAASWFECGCENEYQWWISEGHTVSVFLGILNVVLASSPPSQSCAPTPPVVLYSLPFTHVPLASREGHGEKYFTETSFVLKGWFKYSLCWGAEISLCSMLGKRFLLSSWCGFSPGHNNPCNQSGFPFLLGSWELRIRRGPVTVQLLRTVEAGTTLCGHRCPPHSPSSLVLLLLWSWFPPLPASYLLTQATFFLKKDKVGGLGGWLAP